MREALRCDLRNGRSMNNAVLQQGLGLGHRAGEKQQGLGPEGNLQNHPGKICGAMAYGLW